MHAEDAPPALLPPASVSLGLGYLAKLVFDQTDVQPLWDALVARATAPEPDAAALLDLSMLLQLTGQAEQGLAVQGQALALSPIYRRVHGDGSGLRLLAFMTPGNFMANTPLDFLLEGSNVDLHLMYLEAGATLPALVPDHDVALLAIGESDPNRPLLAAIAPLIAAWPRAVVNGAPDRIAALTRDGVAAMFEGSTRVRAPVARRLDRARILGVAAGTLCLNKALPGAAFPVIIRPVDSHAGHALEKIDDAAALASYLEATVQDEYYLTAFEDYSSPDGLFRKQRLAFIGDQVFVSHLAVSEHWMVHYLNASMAERAERRAEEAAFMASFDTGFALRHAAAFDELRTAFGLDYFAIDCGETKDGRLLLFEADVAMIIHAMDSETLYPYKKPAMQKLFAAFQARLAAQAA